MKYIILAFLSVLLFNNTQLSAAVYNTKHNLSITNATSTTNVLGTIKATSEVEECVFCHIPHAARPDSAPLWNRNMPISAYTMYNSDYLKRMGYPVEADLGSVKGTPGALSRQCLSCHDGTVAVGAVFKLRQAFSGTNTIAMSGTVDGKIPSNASGFLGTNLTMHHPVGVSYSPTISKNFTVGTRTIELKATPDSPIRLFTYGGNSYVECSSCHDPHKENEMFLHVDTGANHAQNVAGTCTSCHDKLNWVGSAHQSVASTVAYTDAAINTKYGTLKVVDLGCVNCHTPHNTQTIAYLTRQVSANTCYQGAASDVATAACHGTGAPKDIQSVANRLYSHPVDDTLTTEKHSNLDALYGTGVVDVTGGKTITWDSNKHAVCMDCHNQHKAQAGTHAAKLDWYPTVPSNLVSGALTGVNGVDVPLTGGWPAQWTQPATFETYESATKEYQICFKCHTYWGQGVSADAATSYTTLGGTILTDVAWELNINNKSGHPVVINANNRVGSDVPKALDTTQLVAPWNTNVGLNTMYCSDCHGADNENSVDPKGPHGSSQKFMLKGANTYWPTKADGVTLWSTNDIPATGGVVPGLFCTNCHNVSIPHKQWKTNMEQKNIKCVECHVAVPHGSPVSRLIGYSNFPQPYNYNGNSLKIQNYKKAANIASGTGAKETNVYFPLADGCLNSACHQSNGGTYDANPYP